MKNMETWRFANEYCGRLWVRLGIVTLLLSLAGFLLMDKSNDTALGLGVLLVISIQSILLLASIAPVEAALRKAFDKDGNPL